jgi:hypothetical protein
MPNTGLHGPYPFTQASLNSKLSRGIGVYVLDRNNNETFEVHYVGRSDVDISVRLSDHIGKGYTRFKYGYLKTAKEAYELECRIYHDFNPPDNVIHPDAPEGLNCTCPVASCSSSLYRQMFGL